jgi:hypothetical protein
MHCESGITHKTRLVANLKGLINNSGHPAAQLVEHYATSRSVAGSISDGVNGIFHGHNPSGRINLGKLQVAHLVKKFVASYRSCKFITMFTKARVYTVILNVVLLYEPKNRLFDMKSNSPSHRCTVKSELSDLSGTEGGSHSRNCRIIRNTNGKG